MLIMTKEELIKDEPKKGFVWYGLRISFWVMILSTINFFRFFQNKITLYIMSIPYFSLLTIVFVPFTLILSIIHLSKYKEKSFAILSLLLSFLLIILYYSIIKVGSF